MAGKKGRNASIKIDNAAGVLTDISRKGKKVSLNFPTEISESTTFQPPGGAKEKTVGDSDFKFTLEGNADSAAATHILGLRGKGEPTGGAEDEGFDYEIGPEGSASGKRKFTGKCLLAEYSEEIDVNGVITFSAQFEGHGDVTVGTFA
jgi:hypothetical protein